MNYKINELKEELKYYLEELEDLELSQTTVKNYNQSINSFINYTIAMAYYEINDNNIDEIMRKYRSHLKNDKKNKPSTRKQYLQEIIQFLKKIGYEINIELPKDKSKNKKIKYLTMEEIQEVEKSIPDSMVRDKAVFQTLYRTGLRVSELANLKKQDLNLESTDKAVSIDVIGGKGGKDRTVYIDQDTLKLLNNMIYKRTRKNKKDTNDYLFNTRTRKQLQDKDIQNIVKKYAIATDERLAKEGKPSNFKEKLTPHTLRHSFAIYLLNEIGKPINEVQALLGHSNLATTNIYAQVDNKTIKKSYESINWNDKII